MVHRTWRRPGGCAVWAAISLLLANSACTTAPDKGGPSIQVFAGLAQQAAGQIKRCYRAPKVASVGKQISTRIRVRFQPDGNLADIPQVVGQTGVTPANQPYAGKMAEAAGLAVMRCAPVKLPPELYAKGWSELDFTFSFAARA
jgi:hypothetical protein